MPRDDAFLLDMVLAARRATAYVIGVDPAAFASSLLHQAAVMRELQIIGEAAGRVSEQTKNRHPHIDWAGVTGLRHRLVHDYRNIRIDIVWHVLQNEVPLLIADLEKIVPPEKPDR